MIECSCCIPLPASMSEPGLQETRHSVLSLAFAGLSLIWFSFLASGYSLGQVIYGLRALADDAPQDADVARSLAYSGVAALTGWLVQLAGALGVAGCVGLFMQRQWSVFVLVVAALLLVWPVLVWTVALVFWNEVDPIGANWMLAHALLTASVGFGMPLLAYVRMPLRV